jgi:hypothetical protein
MKLKYFLLLLLILPLALTSCGFDKDDEPTPDISKDPAGTVIINFTESDEWYSLGYGIGFYYLPGFNMYASDGEIYMIGPVKNIASITKKDIPTTGWSKQAAAIVGYGYVLAGWHDNYAALYVDSEIKSTNGGVYGYLIKVLPLNY